jgi:hypothetical protein
MGKTITPRYQVTTQDCTGYRNAFAWKGRVSPQRLAQWVDAMNASYQPGGVNFASLKPSDPVPVILSAQVRENRANGTTLATWKAPAFFVI